jgi:hypothetical protein
VGDSKELPAFSTHSKHDRPSHSGAAYKPNEYKKDTTMKTMHSRNFIAATIIVAPVFINSMAYAAAGD